MSSSSNTTTNVINPKPCNYNCGTRIYWNTATSEYWEVFTKKKHICPNRYNKPTNTTTTNSTTATTNKPTYYNKKPWSNTQPKPKMSNSLELLSGPIAEIQHKYEILSDIVTEYDGKVFGSQSHISNNNELSIVVYFGVSEGRLNDFKQRFQNNTRAILQQQYRR
ncbi:MAG: hypothetical protein ACRD7F_01730 [Nitrososphaeraceae archaeon]